MRKSITLNLGLCILAFAWGFNSTPVFGEGDCGPYKCSGGPPEIFHSCDHYVREAMEQQLLNARRHCGYSGRYWHDNEQNHRKWCLDVSIFHRFADWDYRRRLLEKCPHSNCEDYATEAIQAQRNNSEMKCGYHGSRWSSEFDDHFNWCEAVDYSEAISETRIRKLALEDCSRSEPWRTRSQSIPVPDPVAQPKTDLPSDAIQQGPVQQTSPTGRGIIIGQ